MQVKVLDAAEWTAMAARFRDLTFEQTAEYAQPAAARIGGRAQFLIVEEAGKPVAGAALRLRALPGLGRGIAWCPAGPLVLPDDGASPDAARLAAILQAMRSRIADRKGHILRLRPAGTAFLPVETVAEAARLTGFSPVLHVRPYQSLAIDLLQDEAELRRRLNPNWRRHLNFSGRAGLDLDIGSGPEFENRFIPMFEETELIKGFRPDIAPQFHFPITSDAYRVVTLIATHDGKDVAGIVLGVCGQVATYLFGATPNVGRAMRAGYFLHWAAIEFAGKVGCRWYDLGGIDAIENPTVTKFKTRMNGAPILAEAWQAVPPGAIGPLILGLERLRTRLRRRGG